MALFAGNVILLYVMKQIRERNQYKLQIQMLKQQKRLQNKSYEILKKRYGQAAGLLHDVNKHMKIMEKLYQEQQKEEAVNYTKAVSDRFNSILSLSYTDNLILNCLLSDKSRTTRRLGIALEIETITADISFMNPMDITTLFGNLLDNAIAACRKCRGEKYIGVFINAFKEMVSVRIENTVSKPVLVKEGRIVHTGDGIGMLNIRQCVEAYEGTIVYKSTDNKLICDIILNRMNPLGKI